MRGDPGFEWFTREGGPGFWMWPLIMLHNPPLVTTPRIIIIVLILLYRIVG